MEESVYGFRLGVFSDGMIFHGIQRDDGAIFIYVSGYTLDHLFVGTTCGNRMTDLCGIRRVNATNSPYFCTTSEKCRK